MGDECNCEKCQTGKYIVGTEEMGTLVAEALAEFADMRHAYHAV